jgi:hypothetical protein
MTWEWSHTPEAYADAEQNLRNLPIDELRIIWAEWCAASRDEWGNWDCNEFDSYAFHKYLNHAEGLSAEALVRDIWDRASELRSCTNGGHLYGIEQASYAHAQTAVTLPICAHMAAIRTR